MSINIYLSGKLRESSMLPLIVADVVAACEEFEWAYQILELDESRDLEGIYFTPGDNIDVCLTFQADGWLADFASFYDGKEKSADDAQVNYTSTTNIEGIKAQAHLRMVQLLRSMGEKYLDNFTFVDEGNYWDTEDDEELLKHLEDYDHAVEESEELLKQLRENPSIEIADIVEELKAITRRVGLTKEV